LSNAPLVAIALGSNLGDRDAHLDFAVSRLSSLLSHIRISSRYDTAPVGVAGEQPPYLNAAVTGRVSLDPYALLTQIQRIEQDRGRERPYQNAPRTLDLDLILYGDVVIADERLDLPHPRFRQRAFVLQPLVEIAPDMVDPVTGLSARDLLGRLDRG
jgi:2-amino-4-hydroxy-6-hydroxymethyldihydropteridine diphosphokinase